MPATGATQFSWNANSEPDLAGYMLYAGRATGTYTDPRSPVNVGNVITTSFNVNVPGAWFFTLAAYNLTGQTGPPASEITDTFTPTPRPVTAMVSGG